MPVWRAIAICLLSAAWLPPAAVAADALPPAAVAADVLHLKGGGVVRGEWIERSVHPREYVMQTAAGRVRVLAAQVERVEVSRSARAEYLRRAPATADTVAAQWELAGWCRDNELHEERQSHLRRVVRLDPDHSQARLLLGHTYHGGRWIARDELMRGNGYREADGRWRIGQEVELTESRRQREKAEKEWLLRLRRLRESLQGSNAASVAAEFAAIRDPHAVPGLRQLMNDDRWQPAKLLYLHALRQIASEAAVALMFDASIRDPDREVRLTSIELLTAMDPPGLAGEYLKVLKSKNNVEVNRAAIALRRLDDESTLVPLIDALVTTHTLVLPGRGSADTMTTTFSPGGGSGLSTGGGAQRLTGVVQNAEVLDALTHIAGCSFGFDQAAWRAWFASRAQAELSQSAP